MKTARPEAHLVLFLARFRFSQVIMELAAYKHMLCYTRYLLASSYI